MVLALASLLRCCAPELSANEAPEHIKENWPGSAWIVGMITDTVKAGGQRTVRRHLLLTSIRNTPAALLRLIRQRWSIENEWHWAREAQLGEVTHRYANRTGDPVFSFQRTILMNLSRRGDYPRTAKACRSWPTSSRKCWPGLRDNA